MTAARNQPTYITAAQLRKAIEDKSEQLKEEQQNGIGEAIGAAFQLSQYSAIYIAVCGYLHPDVRKEMEDAGYTLTDATKEVFTNPREGLDYAVKISW